MNSKTCLHVYTLPFSNLLVWQQFVTFLQHVDSIECGVHHHYQNSQGDDADVNDMVIIYGTMPQYVEQLL